MFVGHFLDHQVHHNLKHLIVHVTNHCNFRCHHCFIDFSPKRDLPLERYQRLAGEVGPLFWVDFGGGEPFLRKDLVNICTSFDCEVMTIPTNGYFVDRVIEMTGQIKEFTRAELTIVISVDGPKKLHDKIREPGSWDKLWKTFEALKKLRGIRVKINTVLCKENFNQIIPLMEEVYQRRPDFHSVILLRGNPIDPAFALPTPRELRSIQDKLYEILSRYDYGHDTWKSRILRNYHRFQWNVSLSTLEQKTQIVPCIGGMGHAVVMGNGDVGSCEMLPPIGNIKDKNWNEVWESAARISQRRSIANKECFCTHNCALLQSVLFRPQSLARIAGPEIKLAA